MVYRFLFAAVAMVVSAVGFAHPNGTYVIDGNEDVTVSFNVLQRCGQAEGALTGKLRLLQFSEAARAEPYGFVTGFYVETHISSTDEAYVQVNYQCIPVESGNQALATRRTIGNPQGNMFSLIRRR